MKKIFLFSILMITITSLSFAYSEYTIALGFEYGFIFDNYTDENNSIKNNANIPSVAVQGLYFKKENSLGVFAHLLFGFPQTLENTENGIITNLNIKNIFFCGMLIGPAYKFNLHDKFNIYCGAGFNLFISKYDFIQYEPYLSKDIIISRSEYSMGIGTDIILQYKFTQNFKLNLGGVFAYNFADYIQIQTEDGRKTNGWAKDFSSFSVRPNITLGITF